MSKPATLRIRTCRGRPEIYATWDMCPMLDECRDVSRDTIISAGHADRRDVGVVDSDAPHGIAKIDQPLRNSRGSVRYARTSYSMTRSTLDGLEQARSRTARQLSSVLGPPLQTR